VGQSAGLNLYRGTSVGPYVLQSMLMALREKVGGCSIREQYPQQLDGVLVDILRRSDSAALAAVVASVATHTRMRRRSASGSPQRA